MAFAVEIENISRKFKRSKKDFYTLKTSLSTLKKSILKTIEYFPQETKVTILNDTYLFFNHY